MMEEEDECVMCWMEKWWQRRKDLLYIRRANRRILVPHCLIHSLECHFCVAVLVSLCCVCCGLNRVNINKIKLLNKLLT